ncbi:MAG: hypothetical protein AB7S38_21895 [Vulcanimicrobiota bacterium]
MLVIRNSQQLAAAEPAVEHDRMLVTSAAVPSQSEHRHRHQEERRSGRWECDEEGYDEVIFSEAIEEEPYSDYDVQGIIGNLTQALKL